MLYVRLEEGLDRGTKPDSRPSAKASRPGSHAAWPRSSRPRPRRRADRPAERAMGRGFTGAKRSAGLSSLPHPVASAARLSTFDFDFAQFCSHHQLSASDPPRLVRFQPSAPRPPCLLRFATSHLAPTRARSWFFFPASLWGGACFSND